MALSVCLSFCLGCLARRGRRSRCFGIPFKALPALNRLPGEAMGFCRGGHALAVRQIIQRFSSGDYGARHEKGSSSTETESFGVKGDAQAGAVWSGKSLRRLCGILAGWPWSPLRLVIAT